MFEIAISLSQHREGNFISNSSFFLSQKTIDSWKNRSLAIVFRGQSRGSAPSTRSGPRDQHRRASQMSLMGSVSPQRVSAHSNFSRRPSTQVHLLIGTANNTMEIGPTQSVYRLERRDAILVLSISVETMPWHRQPVGGSCPDVDDELIVIVLAICQSE